MNQNKIGRTPPVRWIDLGISWFDQYAADGQPASPALNLSEILGYLDTTSLAFLTLHSAARDSSDQTGLILSIHEQISRAEAEFCGRILDNGADLGRWLAEPATGLTWVALCLDQPLTRISAEDFDGLRKRGIHCVPLDPQGNIPQQLEFLESRVSDQGPKLGLDLSEIPAAEIDGVLDQRALRPKLESRTLPLLRSVPASLVEALPDPTLGRLARAGGLVGISLKGSSPDQVRSSIERVEQMRKSQNLPAFLALSSGFLSKAKADPAFSNTARLEKTLNEWFGPSLTGGLLHGHASDFITRWIGPAIQPVVVPNAVESIRFDRPEY